MIREEYFNFKDLEWSESNTPLPMSKIYTEIYFEADEIVNVTLKETKETKWESQIGYHFKINENKLKIMISNGGIFQRQIESQFICISYHSLSKDRDEKILKIVE